MLLTYFQRWSQLVADYSVQEWTVANYTILVYSKQKKRSYFLVFGLPHLDLTSTVDILRLFLYRYFEINYSDYSFIYRYQTHTHQAFRKVKVFGGTSSDRRTANVIKEKGFDSKGVKNCWANSTPRNPSSAGPSCMLTFITHVHVFDEHRIFLLISSLKLPTYLSSWNHSETSKQT